MASKQINDIFTPLVPRIFDKLTPPSLDDFMMLQNVFYSSEEQEELCGPAIDLMNRRAAQMDALQVLTTIPDQWSVSAISEALQTLLKKSLHDVSH